MATLLIKDGKLVIDNDKLVLFDDEDNNCKCCNPCNYPICEDTQTFPETKNVGVQINIPNDTWDFEYNWEQDFTREAIIDDPSCIGEPSRPCIPVYIKRKYRSFRKINITGLSSPNGSHFGTLYNNDGDCPFPITRLDLPHFITTGTYEYIEYDFLEVEFLNSPVPCINDIFWVPRNNTCSGSVPLTVIIVINTVGPGGRLGIGDEFFSPILSTIIIPDIVPDHLRRVNNPNNSDCRIGNLYGTNNFPIPCRHPPYDFRIPPPNNNIDITPPYRGILSDEIFRGFSPGPVPRLGIVGMCGNDFVCRKPNANFSTIINGLAKRCSSQLPIQNDGQNIMPETYCSDSRDTSLTGFYCGNFLNPKNIYTDRTITSWYYYNTRFGDINMEFFNVPV